MPSAPPLRRAMRWLTFSMTSSRSGVVPGCQEKSTPAGRSRQVGRRPSLDNGVARARGSHRPAVAYGPTVGDMRRRLNATRTILAAAIFATCALPGVPAAEDSPDWNFSIDVEKSFPGEMRYVALRELVADLLQPCRLRATSGGTDMALLEAFEGSRRQTARTIFDQLVDDEFIPAQGESVEAQYRSRVVVIDPFVFGRSRFWSDGVPDGFTVEVWVEGHLLQVLMTRTADGHGGRADYGVTIWDWDSDDRSKTCGFSYHY